VAPVVVGVALLGAGPAAASCAELTPASLLDGGEVMLGTAVEVDGHRAVLDLEEVWSGPDRAPRYRVVTGETSPTVGSSGDVELVEGERYLVALRGSRTDACSVLVVGDGGDVTTAELDAARPADVRAPVEGADGGGDGPVVPLAAAGAGGALAAVLAGVLVVAVRRRPRADGAPRGLR